MAVALSQKTRRRMAREATSAKSLLLTREEAFALLELAVASPSSPGEGENAALVKLGELCRAFFRDEALPPPCRSVPAPSPSGEWRVSVPTSHQRSTFRPSVTAL
jgi:hypothetical protein